jgi:endonuclease YncB( thermonuclease family)
MTSVQGSSRVHKSVALLATGLFALFASPATALPICLPPEIGKAQVAEVADGGVLILKDHRKVKLEGLLWPPEKDAEHRRQATSALRRLTLGRKAHLRVTEPKFDRYKRLRAQVILPEGRWLQQALLLQGLARVSLPPDRHECAHELYTAEAHARESGTGLWALAAYAVRTPEFLRWTDLGTFQIVEGKVLNVKVSSSRAYLDFGRNWRTDFTVTIAPEDMKTFRRANIDPYSYGGKSVRVRGYIDRLHGFEIEVAAPEAIEVLN